MINERQAHKFCRDEISKIENYEKAITDTTQTWHLHHRLELTLEGEFAHTRDDLIRLGMYYRRPYFELIFLTHSEHRRLHMKGKARSEESRKKQSDANKGENNPFYGQHHSNESRKKMSEAQKARRIREKLK